MRLSSFFIKLHTLCALRFFRFRDEVWKFRMPNLIIIKIAKIIPTLKNQPFVGGLTITSFWNLSNFGSVQPQVVVLVVKSCQAFKINKNIVFCFIHHLLFLVVWSFDGLLDDQQLVLNTLVVSMSENFWLVSFFYLHSVWDSLTI